MTPELVPDLRTSWAAGRAEQILDNKQFEDSTGTVLKIAMFSSAVLRLECFADDEQKRVAAEYVEHLILSLLFNESAVLLDFWQVYESVGNVDAEPLPTVHEKLLASLSL